MTVHISPTLEIRRLKPSHVLELAKILDCFDGWKTLMCVIPQDCHSLSGELKYTTEHICLIEEAGKKQGRSCSEILFEEWGTSGKKRADLRCLLQCLVKAELYRAADYVADKILKVPLPQRPGNGPAATVSVPVPGGSEYTLSENEIRIAKTELMDDRLFENFSITDKVSDVQESDTSAEVSTANTVLDVRAQQETLDIPHITYEELKILTNNFHDNLLLGKGAFGSVYFGQQLNRKIAVKRLDKVNEAGSLMAQFKTELDTMTKCRHNNLLPLLAISEDSIPCLVYQFMPNGSLQERLACMLGKPPLNWRKRVDITNDIVEGLYYMHTNFEKPLIHRDIKSANVLLDSNDVAKIGDFGLVRSTGGSLVTSIMTTTIIGTSAYMAREAFCGDISPRMDVYSLGVVLLEILTGLPAYDEKREEVDLISLVDEMDDGINSLLDTKADSWNEIAANRLYDISNLCLQDKKNRPYIQKIKEMISDLIIELN